MASLRIRRDHPGGGREKEVPHSASSILLSLALSISYIFLHWDNVNHDPFSLRGLEPLDKVPGHGLGAQVSSGMELLLVLSAWELWELLGFILLCLVIGAYRDIRAEEERYHAQDFS